MIALIDHDKKKREMVEFIRQHVEFLRTQRLVATGHIRCGNSGSKAQKRLALHGRDIAAVDAILVFEQGAISLLLTKTK